MLNHGVTFNLGTAKVCSTAIFEINFGIYGLLQLIIICSLPNCDTSIYSYTLINKFYSFITFSFLINVVVLLLNCHFKILSSINFLSLKPHFLKIKHYLDLYMTDNVCAESLYISWC